jgi:molecular chaperone GrpE
VTFGENDNDENDAYDLDVESGDGEATINDGASGDSKASPDLKNEIDELKRQNLYLLADFDNYRKQAIKERSDLAKYGNESIVREFLSVLDNLERAAATELKPETMETYKNGVQMIVAQFKKALEKFGVEEVNPEGQLFDPAMHEALSSSNEPDLPANTVTQVLSKAYKLKGKVIRPAQVVVNTPRQ